MFNISIEYIGVLNQENLIDDLKQFDNLYTLSIYTDDECIVINIMHECDFIKINKFCHDFVHDVNTQIPNDLQFVEIYTHSNDTNDTIAKIV